MLEQVAEDSKKSAGCKEHGKRIPHNPFCPLWLVCSARHGKQRRAAHSEQIGECGNNSDDRQGKTDACQCLRGCMRNVADIDAVHNVI